MNPVVACRAADLYTQLVFWAEKCRTKVPTVCPKYLLSVQGTYCLTKVPTVCPRYLLSVHSTYCLVQPLRRELFKYKNTYKEGKIKNNKRMKIIKEISIGFKRLKTFESKNSNNLLAVSD